MEACPTPARRLVPLLGWSGRPCPPEYCRTPTYQKRCDRRVPFRGASRPHGIQKKGGVKPNGYLLRPSEVSEVRCSQCVRSRTHPSSSEVHLPSEVRPARVPRYRFRDPAAPSALAPALRFSDERAITGCGQASGNRLPSGWTPLASLPQRILAGRRTAPAPLMGFWSLQHMPATAVHVTRVCRTRFVPSSGFGYPPDGFLPPKPRRACFVPTALLGFPSSELSPLARQPPRSHGGEPTYRFSTRCIPPPKRRNRHKRPRFLGFDPRENP